jgi:hypothetical protein
MAFAKDSRMGTEPCHVLVHQNSYGMRAQNLAKSLSVSSYVPVYELRAS